jgi:signal transduction histidine kinase
VTEHLDGSRPNGQVVVDERPSVRAARRLPSWMGSLRFRIAMMYSVILFGLAGLALGAVYWGLSRELSRRPVTEELEVELFIINGRPVPFDSNASEVIERRANQKAMDALRQYAAGSLLGLFAASFVVGWIVSGQVLKPIGRITDVARDIQATDLSRRIGLEGPEDELKDLADTFDEMLGRLDQAFESQRQFIHEASHELRNPLAVIRTNLDVTLSDPHVSADDLRDAAKVVQKSTDRMTRLVDDLLIYARKGSLSLERERVDLSTITQEAADEFAPSAAAHQVRLDHAAPDGLWVDGDRLALRQALANLLANALRLSPEHSVIRVSAGREGPWVWMAVEDQGPGVAVDDHERIFQRFWRGDPRAGREAGRSGLGLTIVRQIAEAHGGQVKLASEPGRGAAFAVWLPAGPPDPAVSTDSAPSVVT